MTATEYNTYAHRVKEHGAHHEYKEIYSRFRNEYRLPLDLFKDILNHYYPKDVYGNLYERKITVIDYVELCGLIIEAMKTDKSYGGLHHENAYYIRVHKLFVLLLCDWPLMLDYITENEELADRDTEIDVKAYHEVDEEGNVIDILY